MFNAILLEKPDAGFQATMARLNESQLPEGDVTVAIDYSTINYKDALALTNRSPVVRKWPMVPGIDFAGRVVASSHPEWQEGDRVLLNGWGVGEAHWGGLAQRARVSGNWLLPLPDEFTPWQAMAIGTAGYTAMLCVLALERQGIVPARGPVLVTGANGGVGTIAIMLLAALGYQVHASTGRLAEAAHLKTLGASEVIDRATLSAPGKPLGKERWAAAVDAVGSHTLANICASLQYGGAVAACGLAQGMDFPASVAPFILRGVSLLGVDSVMLPRSQRSKAWERLATDLDADRLGQISQEIALADALAVAPRLLAGEVRGRLVVDVNR